MYDICAFFYDSLTCNSHVDDIDTHVDDTQVDAHVDDIIHVKYHRFVGIANTSIQLNDHF